MSKVLPKLYGDRQTLDLTAKVTTVEEPVSDIQLAREIAYALHLGMKRVAAARAAEEAKE